ncbi:MAG: prolipoprotein diacylglyceryl transferase [Limisphaerales bacterium]
MIFVRFVGEFTKKRRRGPGGTELDQPGRDIENPLLHAPGGRRAMHVSSYSLWMVAGVVLSCVLWVRAGRRDPRLPVLFLAGLLGAFLGAKIVYLLAEGWRDWPMPDRWTRWSTGKTILGGLIFGYVGVELAKKALGYTEATGDRFAEVVPVGLFLGRLGCLSHGCCPGQACPASAWYARVDADGVARWPAVPAELAFHALAFAAVLGLRVTQRLRGQRFHAYLIAYGVFRFYSEFHRDTARVMGPLSGYHLAAVVLVALGCVRWIQRARMA